MENSYLAGDLTTISKYSSVIFTSRDILQKPQPFSLIEKAICMIPEVPQLEVSL